MSLPLRNSRVYDWCMSRTNIVLDDEAVEIIMKRYGMTTKTEAVNTALRSLAGQPMTVDEMLAMEGANFIDPDEIPADSGPR